MTTEDEPETPVEFGARLALAISLSGKSETRVQREAGLMQGRIHRLLGKGKNPIFSPGPEVIRALADCLEVSYEWLAIGRGPRKRGAWAPSPKQSAELVARSSGIGDGVIASASARYADASLTALEWVGAFAVEAGRSSRSRARELAARAESARAEAAIARRAALLGPAEGAVPKPRARRK